MSANLDREREAKLSKLLSKGCDTEKPRRRKCHQGLRL